MSAGAEPAWAFRCALRADWQCAGRGFQADVVAVNWRTKVALVGECKWGAGAVDREIVLGLLALTVADIRSELSDDPAAWTITTAIFARAGLTPPAAALHAAGGIAVTTEQLDADLP